MIAIDDSASMQANGQFALGRLELKRVWFVAAGRLALESLTVLCRALTQLEVPASLPVPSLIVLTGWRARCCQFWRYCQAPASFRQGSLLCFRPVIHIMSWQPFSGESGAFVISQFQFKQQKTQWAQVLRLHQV